MGAGIRHVRRERTENDGEGRLSGMERDREEGTAGSGWDVGI